MHSVGYHRGNSVLVFYFLKKRWKTQWTFMQVKGEINMSEEKAIYSVDKNIDISKIIDDAMEKKDRTVTIFISNVGTTVKVTPTVDDDPRWIKRTRDLNSDPTCFIPPTFKCSSCFAEAEYPTSYCPHCGEKLKMPEVNDEY